MKTLFLALFIALAFVCTGQTKSDSVSTELDFNSLTSLKEMSQQIGVYIDSISYTATDSKINALTLSEAANIPRKRVKLVASEKKKITVSFRKEILIGNY